MNWKKELSGLTPREQLERFEFLRDQLNVKTVSAYGFDHGKSYNGARGRKVLTEKMATQVGGKNFICDI